MGHLNIESGKRQQHTSIDWSISCIRFIAFTFIIICHILQYFGNGLCWWFNVGVQIFLAISGFTITADATFVRAPVLMIVNFSPGGKSDALRIIKSVASLLRGLFSGLPFL